MSGIPISHRTRSCFVCASTVEPKDTLAVGCMRPWHGRIKRGGYGNGSQRFICQGCLRSSAFWLSGVSDRQALALIQAARKAIR